MLSFSTLHNYITKNYFINGLLFQDRILKFHKFFQHVSPNPGLFMAGKIKR